MSYRIRSALLAAALIGTPVIARADVSEAERDFINKAAMSGHEEVSTGHTAAESKNTAVAAFGRQMVTDHTKMNAELATIAKSRGVEPPDSASLMQRAEAAAVSVLPGSTFDKTYVSQQLAGHKEALGLLQNEASTGTDPQLKAFAQTYIPVVEQHIAELEKLQQMPELQ